MRLFVRLLIVPVMFLVTACGSFEGLRTARTTPDAMYSSIAEFYSVYFDRSDITSGTYKLWPKEGDLVGFEAVVEALNVTSKVEKELRRGGTVLEIKTRYFAHAELSPIQKAVRYRSRVLSRDVATAYTFVTIINKEIDEQAAKALSSLKKGDKIWVRGKVENPAYPSYFDEVGTILEGLMMELPEVRAAVLDAVNRNETFAGSTKLWNGIIQQSAAQVEKAKKQYEAAVTERQRFDARYAWDDAFTRAKRAKYYLEGLQWAVRVEARVLLPMISAAR